MEISIEGERSKKIFEDFRLPQMWLVLIDSGCGDFERHRHTSSYVCREFSMMDIALILEGSGTGHHKLVSVQST